MTSHLRKQIIALSQEVKTIRQWDLVSYRIKQKHFSWEIIYKMWWRNNSQAPFQKIEIELISGLKLKLSLKFLTLLYCIPSWGLSKCIKTKLHTTCFYLIYKAVLKNKKRSATSLPISFSAWILEKNNSLVIFYNLTKFHCLVAFTSRDIGQYVYGNGCVVIVC